MAAGKPNDSESARLRVFTALLLLLSSMVLFAVQYSGFSAITKVKNFAIAPALRPASAFAGDATLPALSSRRVALSPHALAKQRIMIRVFEDTSGGGHCVAQLSATAAKTLGLAEASLDREVSSWKKMYTGGIRAGLPGGFQAGDMYFVHEFHDKGIDTGSGSKTFVYELGDVPLQGGHRGAKYFGHTFYTRDYLRMPRRALVRPFVNPSQWEEFGPLPATPADIAQYKQNVVLCDDELPDVLSSLQRLSSRYPDLDVVEVRNWNKQQMADLFKKAKVYVDANMRGAERVGQEALLYHVVPILQHERNGENEYDYNIPASMKWDSVSIPGHGDLLARVDAVLADWANHAARIQGARATVFAHSKLQAIDLSRLLSVTLNVHIMECGKDSKSSAAAVLLAAAVHFLAPAASTTLHTGKEQGAFDEATVNVMMAANDGTSGVLAFNTIVPSSPICGADAAAARKALTTGKQGHQDLEAVLSWRLLPLRPQAFNAWQDALRASTSTLSVLTLHGVALGALWKYDPSTPPAWRPVQDGSGAIKIEGQIAPLAWPPASAAGQWADLKHLDSIPYELGVELDEAVMDQVIVMNEAGVDVLDPAVGLPGHGDVLRVFKQKTRTSAYLCSQLEFKRIAGQTGSLEALCKDALLGSMP